MVLTMGHHAGRFSNPEAIVAAGQKIYKDMYQADYEKNHPGRFVAIDVLSEKAYLADQPEEALRLARKDSPDGLFHLIRVGAPGAFKVSYSSSNAPLNWYVR